MVFTAPFSAKERRMAGAMVRHCIQLLDKCDKPVNKMSESEKEDLIAELVESASNSLHEYE